MKISTSIQPCPRRSSRNMGDGVSADVKSSCNLTTRYFLGEQDADRSHAFGGKFCLGIPRSARRPVVLDRILHVHVLGAPPDIVDAVVRSRPITMKRAMCDGWGRSMEGGANQSMDIVKSLPRAAGHGDFQISMGHLGRRENFPGDSAARLPGSPDAPKAADLVGPAFDGAPFFSRIRGRDFVSHRVLPIQASVVRGRRGLQSSRPRKDTTNPKQSGTNRKFWRPVRASTDA